jgi:hypothetical protein
MHWLDKIQVSLYRNHFDNIGRQVRIREALLCPTNLDIELLIKLRRLDRADQGYKKKQLAMKEQLRCFTPAAVLETKTTGHVKLISRSGFMQLDFDHAALTNFDIEEVKQCIGDLPFIAFCARSCSGDGFYALALIAEPERLSEYAEHCFYVLENKYGIKADTSKGKKIENLRYCSYDENTIINHNPVPLRIKRFKTKPAQSRPKLTQCSTILYSGSNATVEAMVKKVQVAQKGERWPTIQKAAYTLGGLGNHASLTLIKDAIKANNQFSGEEDKYIKCAEECFADGLLKPLLK